MLCQQREVMHAHSHHPICELVECFPQAVWALMGEGRC